MDLDIFEVSQDEYRGFIAQIKPECRNIEAITNDDGSQEMHLFSVKTGKKLCSKITDKEGYERYYVIEMPDDDERRAPKPVQKFIIETKEEAQAFMNIMAKFLKKE